MGSPCPGPARRPCSPTHGVFYRVLHAQLDRFLERIEAGWEELFRWLCRRSEEEGVLATRPGAVNVIQRFDSVMRVNVHFHTLLLSGVYAGGSEEAVFHELPAPTPEYPALILHEICFCLEAGERSSGLDGAGDSG